MIPGIHQSIQQKSWLLKASRPSYLETRLSKLKYKNTFKSVDNHLGEQRQVTRITLESKDKSNCSASSFEMRWGANFEAEFVPSFKSMIPSSSKYLTQRLNCQNFFPSEMRPNNVKSSSSRAICRMLLSVSNIVKEWSLSISSPDLMTIKGNPEKKHSQP